MYLALLYGKKQGEYKVGPPQDHFNDPKLTLGVFFYVKNYINRISVVDVKCKNICFKINKWQV